jgi:hypothetical protein
MILCTLALCAVVDQAQPTTSPLQSLDLSALHLEQVQHVSAAPWEPIAGRMYGEAVPTGATPAMFNLQVNASLVPTEALNDITRDLYSHVKGILGRAVQVVSRRTNCRDCAYILLGVQGHDPDGNGVVDSYTDWEKADFDDDGQFDSQSGESDAATPQQVARQLEADLNQVDAVLRKYGR